MSAREVTDVARKCEDCIYCDSCVSSDEKKFRCDYFHPIDENDNNDYYEEYVEDGRIEYFLSWNRYILEFADEPADMKC